MQRLRDVARYVRSKNAGPFWVTIDVFCEDDNSYERLCRTPALGAQAIATLYGLNAAQVRIFQDRALRVIKISFPRPIAQGSARDADSHAGQYFVPLMNVPVGFPAEG